MRAVRIVPVILLALLVGAALGDDKSAALLTEGRAALEDGLCDLARRRFEGWLKDSGKGAPETERAAVAELLARALFEQGKFDEILAVLDGKRGWDRATVTGPAFSFWRGLARCELGETTECIAELAGFEKEYRGSEYCGRALRLRASAMLKLGKPDEATTAFAEFDARFPDAPDAPDNLLLWAGTLTDLGKIEPAGQVFERLIAGADDNPAVQNGRYAFARLLIARKQGERAAGLLSALAGNENASGDLRGEALLALGAIQVSAGNVQDAARSFSNGIARARSPALQQRGRFALGTLLLKDGKLEIAVPLLKAFIASNPKSEDAEAAQMRIGDALLDQEHYREAVDEFQYYLETFTNSIGQAKACYGRGWGLQATGRFAEAATAFLKAYELYTGPADKARCLFKAGDACFANGQYKLAKGDYERCLTEYPDSELRPNILFQLGETVSRMGDPVEAEALFRRVMDEHKDSPLAEDAAFRIACGNVAVAETYERQGLWSEAMAWFGKAADGYTELMNVHTNGALYAEALHGRGQVYFQLFRFERAIADFSDVIERFPKSGVVDHAYYMRGLCYYRMFQDEKALAAWEGFGKRFPKSEWGPRVMFEIGKYRYNRKNYVEAEKQFMLFADTCKTDPLADDALLWAGISAARQKEYTRAVELFARMAGEFPQSTRLMPKARFEQADALCSLGRYSDAITILDEIINKFPDSDLVLPSWLRKGACQFMLGAEDKKRYEEAIESNRVVVNNSNAGLELVLEAEYKIGRCHQFLGRDESAIEQYHSKVMVRYIDAVQKGVMPNEACKKWFTRASLNAADILEQGKDWRKVISILQRIVDADVSASPKAAERIKEIRSKNWWLFY